MPHLITEKDILDTKKAGQSAIYIEPETIITPSARDAARACSIRFVAGKQQESAQKILPVSQKLERGPIAIGSDHGGFEMKEMLIAFLQNNGFKMDDLGCYSSASVDYPDIAHIVAKAVNTGQATLGIIIDGVGVGSAMVANKVPGIRAACCNELFSAVNSREHNGANVLTLGGRIIGDELAKKIVMIWLTTDFGGGRHKKRLDKISQIDEQYRPPA
ncbi:ribose 5-phosphate isomerase B [candidate division KSB1 bacterium]|nr:ribose 5-phosphate isomerase B [candidate division KSB1 bacterium]